jgi:hypothetical protein
MLRKYFAELLFQIHKEIFNISKGKERQDFIFLYFWKYDVV